MATHLTLHGYCAPGDYEQGVEEQRLRRACDEAGAELAEDRRIKAGTGIREL
jgi:hypothetical protein